MDFKEIQELIRMVNKSDLTDVVIKDGEFKIRISRQLPETNVVYSATSVQQQQPQNYAVQAQAPVAPVAIAETKTDAPKAEVVADNLYTFRSPMIGTFYNTPSPNDPPFVRVGDTISKGQKLCIVEAMKLFNEIESDVAGKIVKVLVENARPVEYDQPLFLIEKA